MACRASSRLLPRASDHNFLGTRPPDITSWKGSFFCPCHPGVCLISVDIVRRARSLWSEGREVDCARSVVSATNPRGSQDPCRLAALSMGARQLPFQLVNEHSARVLLYWISHFTISKGALPLPLPWPTTVPRGCTFSLGILSLTLHTRGRNVRDIFHTDHQ